jgi:hypothetical protein
LPHWGAYVALAYSARRHGLRLLNTTAQTRRAMELDRWYPKIKDLTAESVIISDARDLPAAQAIGFPLFVKGLIKSNKELGLDACLARDQSELRSFLLAADGNRIAARRLLELRPTGEDRLGFPVSREYRVYLYRGTLLGLGYYWGGKDPFGLARSERAELIALAQEAQARLDVPLLAVDVGQLASGPWRVIEVGDPQFSGLAHMPRPTFWTRLRELSEV